MLRMAYRKWKEIKQQPSMLPVPTVPGSCLVPFHFLWAILSTRTVHAFDVSFDHSLGFVSVIMYAVSHNSQC